MKRVLPILLLILAYAVTCNVAWGRTTRRPRQAPRPPQAPAFVIAVDPVVKSCPCSDACVCGCNAGQVCDCGNTVASRPSQAPQTLSVTQIEPAPVVTYTQPKVIYSQPQQTYYQPQQPYYQPQYAMPTQRSYYRGSAGFSSSNCGPGG